MLALRVKNRKSVQLIIHPPCEHFKGSDVCNGCVHRPPEAGQPIVVDVRKEDEKLVLSSTLLSQVSREKAGILSSDAMMDNRFKEARSIIMQGIRSSMAVPIMHHQELLGIMIVDSSVAVNAYTEKDLHLLTNIVNQTAQFIKNSQMAQKIERDATTRERFQRLLSPDLAELRNIALVGLILACSAKNRLESRGLHFLSDRPETDEIPRETWARLVGAEVEVRLRELPGPERPSGTT